MQRFWEENYREHFNHDKNKSEVIRHFKKEIYQPFQAYRIPLIRLTSDTPKDAVCKVFENVNTGGVTLTVFELITATFASDEFDLREDWKNKQKTLKSYKALSKVDETAFLTAITLYCSYKKYAEYSATMRIGVSCKKKDVLNLTLSQYKNSVDVVLEGFIKSAKLLQREKVFSPKDLPYQTQLIPLAVVCSILGNSFENERAKSKLIRWYWSGVLGELYGGANETRFALDVTGLIEWINGGEPPMTVNDCSFTTTRLLTLQTRNSAAYKGIMILLMKKGCNDFINGDPIELTSYFDENIDIHHVFPRAYCEKMNFERKYWNSIINKTPLSYRTNRIIGGNRPSQYLDNIEKKQKIGRETLNKHLETHLINVRDMREDEFINFISSRASSILDLIEEATGKAVNGRNSEETIQAFGISL